MSNSVPFSPRHDLPAGVVVSLVALPLCLGIALASGAPLFAGLISGIVGGVVVGALSGSQLSVSGPAAGLTSIVLSSVTQLGVFESFLTAVVLAGVFQLLLGWLKAGSIVNYFPSAVISGMLAGIGIIIILKQLPHAMGYDKVPEGEERFFQADNYNTFSELSHLLDTYTSPGAIIICLVGLAIMLAWQQPFAKKLAVLPGALVAVLAGVGLNQFFLKVIPSFALVDKEHLVRVPVPESFSALVTSLSHPNWSALSNPNVWIVALTIAVVASIESLLSLDAVDRIDPLKRHSPANREIFAQGAGNIVSGLLGGLPLTSVIVRSSANVNSGAKTKASAITHGIILLLCVLFIPRLLNLIPLASLAAVLLLTGWKLAKVSVFKDMYKRGWLQFLPFISTIVAMVLTDLLKGVGLGLLISIVFILLENMKHSFNMEEENGTKHIKLGPHITYLHKAHIMRTLESVAKEERVVVDGSHCQFLDPDVVDALREFQQNKAPAKGFQLELHGDAFSAPIRSNAH
jgi:carbonic anhydrase